MIGLMYHEILEWSEGPIQVLASIPQVNAILWSTSREGRVLVFDELLFHPDGRSAVRNVRGV